MPSQQLIGKQIRKLGRTVLELKHSRRLSGASAGSGARPYLAAFALFFAVPLAGMAALYLSVPDETLTSTPNRHLTSVTVRLPDLRGQLYSENVAYEPVTHETLTRDADTLTSVFARLGIRDTAARRFIEQSEAAADLTAPAPGRFVTASIDEKGQLLELSFYIDSDVIDEGRRVRVRRTSDGFTCEQSAFDYAVELAMVNGRVRTGVEKSLSENGVPGSVVAQMHSAFDYDRDVVARLEPGDTYRLIYEKKYAQGSFVRYGRLLAMQLEHGGRTTELFWFKNDDEGGNYYTADGHISRRTFMRVPLDVKSVSSEFSPMRKHPVTGVIRPHYGTDFRAPWGAIVRAAADGVVDFAGVGTGYGNYIRILHGNEILTLYAHLSSIDPAVQKGAVVKRGTIIGRVGQTGLATGPHLHYELKFDGEQINPMTVRLPERPTLSPYRFAQMEVLVAPLRAKLALLARSEEPASTQTVNTAALTPSSAN